MFRMKVAVKIGIIFSMILLFFPTILVSCEGSEVYEASTAEMALGMVIEDGEVVEDEDIPINVFAIAIMVLLVVALFQSFKDEREGVVGVLLFSVLLLHITVLAIFPVYYDIDADYITVEPTNIWYISGILYFVLMIMAFASKKTETDSLQGEVSAGPQCNSREGSSNECNIENCCDEKSQTDSERLKELKRLYERGLISEEEYNDLSKL